MLSMNLSVCLLITSQSYIDGSEHRSEVGGRIGLGRSRTDEVEVENGRQR